MRQPPPTLTHRSESGRLLPMLLWRFPRPARVIASGPLGGGIGLRRWVMNATVDKSYDRLDPDVHLTELAGSAGLVGVGVGMLTAVDVNDAVSAEDEGVTVVATVGLEYPTWAAAPDGHLRRGAAPGTINIVAVLPVPFADAGLVNLVSAATEAKVQALLECGIEATGSASDALCLVCPATADADGELQPEPFGGPRSTWGARLARAVRTAVAEGTRGWLSGHRPDYRPAG